MAALPKRRHVGAELALSTPRSRRAPPVPTHIRRDGSLTMVDVGAKPVTQRLARARALVRMSPAQVQELAPI